MTLKCQISTFYWMVQMTPNLTQGYSITKGIDILKIFDLDLKLKVTEPFEGQKVTFSSSLLLKIEVQSDIKK